MSTNIFTTDLRSIEFEFKDISSGTMFTHDGCSIPYIKMPIFYVLNEEEKEVAILSKTNNNKFNAIDLRGERHWFDYDCRIHPIERISITMK